MADITLNDVRNFLIASIAHSPGFSDVLTTSRNDNEAARRVIEIMIGKGFRPIEPIEYLNEIQRVGDSEPIFIWKRVYNRDYDITRSSLVDGPIDRRDSLLDSKVDSKIDSKVDIKSNRSSDTISIPIARLNQSDFIYLTPQQIDSDESTLDWSNRLDK